MKALRCANCGAPLEVEDHESLVQCRFCQATTRVRDRTLHMAAPVVTPTVRPTAPVLYTPPPGAEWPAAERREPARRPRRSLAPLLVALTVLGGAGAAAFSLTNPNGLSNLLGGLAALQPAPVQSSCVVDANGDAVLDVVALRSSGSASFAEIFDGATGASRWRGEDIAGGPHLICSGHHIALALGDFTARIYDVRSPGTPLVVRGSDVIQTIRRGPGCLELGAADGSRLSVAVDGSDATECVPEGGEDGVNTRAAGIMGLTSSEVELQDGDEVLRLSARQRGTEMLSLRPSTHAAEHPTSLMKCTFSAAIAASPSTIFVQACVVGADKASLIVAFRRADLAELWRVPIADGSAWNVEVFGWNGRALVVGTSGALYAIDGTTGATLWSVR